MTTRPLSLIKGYASHLVNEGRCLNYGRHIIKDWVCEYSSQLHSMTILDIGCGSGGDLLIIKNCLDDKKYELFGIETDQNNIEKATHQGIAVLNVNIESDTIPAPDASFDIMIANQIMEHTKEIFWIFSEISRVLKSGGLLIVGIPNLASLHNRLLLLVGQQPTTIRLLGPHVRGITKPTFVEFVSAGNYFVVEDFKGSNFYPFPQAIAKRLSRLLPSLSVSIFFKIRRTDKEGTFIEMLRSRSFETPFFQGDRL